MFNTSQNTLTLPLHTLATLEVDFSQLLSRRVDFSVRW